MRPIYTTAMDECDIQRDDQVSLLNHILCGQAKDFYFDRIQGRVTQNGEAFTLLTNRFDTDRKRAQSIAFLVHNLYQAFERNSAALLLSH